jgi:hypothetical protein
MNIITRPTAAVLLVLFSTFLTAAQQKRHTPAKTPPKPAVAPTPAPTFDTLIPADSYMFYGEVRGVGQLVRNDTVNELLEPILKLAGPPKEFNTLVKWLNEHADEVMTSRLLVATWPRASEVPEAIIAIEFASSEEATKFAKPLNQVLPTILPPVIDNAPPEPGKPLTPENAKTAKQERPGYYFQQSGSLILLSPKPFTLKQLKPAGSKPLAEEQNFRAARNRFNSEPLFVFIDFKAMEKQQEERMKQFEEENKKAEAERLKAAEAEPKQPEEPPEPEMTEEEKAAILQEEMAQLQTSPSPEPAKEQPTPNPVSTAFNELASSFFRMGPVWPEALGLALSIENDSFDLRALLVNSGGVEASAVPFMPLLVPGPAFVPEAPNIFPADTELFATMSVDLPQVYEILSTPPTKSELITTHGRMVNVSDAPWTSPFVPIEKQLKIKVKDDLLPLLGSEIALRLPLNGFGVPGVFSVAVPVPENKDNSEPKNFPAPVAPVVAISVKDRDGMRALIPKLIEGLGFKGASALAQTERREDTELVSFANLFSYAFIGDFLVLSSDPATIRHVVDSYLKHETLASELQFKSFTRWQPRPMQGQFYISPSLMESYKKLTDQPSSLFNEETRAILSRLTAVPQPITYALTNEGFGPLHELHLPKNLVLMAVAGLSGEANPPPGVRNERMAYGVMYSIANAENQYKADKGAGSYGTLEQLITAELISKEMMESSGYKFELTVSGDKFEVTAVPAEYGKTGIKSMFMDNTMVLRGGDRNGAAATSSDPPIN